MWLRLLCDFRQPEVQQLRAGFGQHDVAGLKIPMRYSLAMRLVQRIRDLHRDLGLTEVQRSPSELCASDSPSRYSMTR